MKPTTQEPSIISILYVEDDQSVMDIVLSMLEPKYPEVRFLSADNGRRGLGLFRKERPQIVITDISMPKLSGLGMSSEIKNLAPATIIIAVTAHSETNNLLQAIEIGINHYVMKPVDYERLCFLIDQSIAIVRKDQLFRDQQEQVRILNTALMAKTRELEALNLELEAFNYTVAHDLRAPMVSIGGFSEYLLSEYAAGFDEKSTRYLQVIQSEIQRMNSLIDTLLDFSSCTSKGIHKKMTDLSSIANEITGNLLQREPRRSVSFKVAEGVQVFADPALMYVVLENLLSNAWKYSADTVAACIEFGAITTCEEPAYFVRDNGSGFDQQAADQLFLPFQRLSSCSEINGHGIGLATVSRIIRRHGGRVWAEGEKERGATFYFSL